MVQVDLITGFLGAGKTTFLRRYAAYLTAQGHHVCILENDFGAVNVDAMLVQDLLGERCEIETISGGCDCDTHQRRMRTKLISMAMRGFDRVVVEPSGIFDVDEFFDVLRDEPLDRWYTLGNVFTVVDALLPETLSPQAEYILASEAASAGRILLSRSQLATQAQREGAIDHLKRALAACKCSRTLTEEDFLIKDWADLEDGDLAALDACGYQHTDCEKLCFDAHDAFGSAYFLELGLPPAAAGSTHSQPVHRCRLRPGAAGQGLCAGCCRLGGAECHRRRPDCGPHSGRAGGAHRHRRRAGQGTDRSCFAELRERAGNTEKHRFAVHRPGRSRHVGVRFLPGPFLFHSFSGKI